MEVFNIITLEFLKEANKYFPSHASINCAEAASAYAAIFDEYTKKEIEEKFFDTCDVLTRWNVLEDRGSNDQTCEFRLTEKGYKIIHSKVNALETNTTFYEVIKGYGQKFSETALTTTVAEFIKRVTEGSNGA